MSLASVSPSQEGERRQTENNKMTCPKCGNEKVKKLFIAGTSYEEANKFACNKCEESHKEDNE